MAKQLNMSLSFNADTAKAKAQIQELQRSLDQLVSGSVAKSASNGLPITKELNEAQIAATRLQTILAQSMNVKTGNLDLTKFTQSMNGANMKLSTLKTQLDRLGPAGQQAFVSLAQSIVTADVPLTRTNKLLSDMWTTVKNTARWQLSSSVLHGVMGAYQQAMGYAKDLDESLNNIRIVTGQNVDQMARFAEQANKAAKALSTTTTEYTNASLIFYQQGLDDAEVAKRTEVTVKMANASGQSAQVVSDQLTAVWNNFYDGSKSLEYYADVMTALGAATASSSEEIAGGLEKFAAIGNTIGLSYEYAASALATITANTRQSEEVVGTALKTIFARIQGLNLGETLDDGTTLNKYSEALQKVGISIFEQNGEIKKMDNILDEMGAKWQTLSKDQQIALAQTVAGVRQYNQLVSLMDNWDAGDSDSMMANLDTAKGAEGTLQKQADIYAESWEAARDRVKAATEDLYDSLIDEKFFIGIANGFEKIISGIANFTDSVNGLPGILTLIASVMTRAFGKDIAKSIDNLKFNILSMTGLVQEEANRVQTEAAKMAESINFNTGTEAGDIQGVAMQRRIELQQEMKKVADSLTEEEREQLTELLKINDAYAEQATLAAKAKDAATKDMQDNSMDVRRKIKRNEGKEGAMSVDQYKEVQQEMTAIAQKGAKTAGTLKELNAHLKKGDKEWDGYGDSIKEVVAHMQNVGRGKAASQVEQLHAKFKAGEMSAEDFQQALRALITEEDILQDASIEAANTLHSQAQASGVTEQECDKLADSMVELAVRTRESDTANDAYKQSFIELKQHIQGFNGAMDSFGTRVTKSMQGISSLLMGINSLAGMFDVLNNKDLSFGEKLYQTMMSLTMAIPSLIMGMQALNKESREKMKADLVEIGTTTKKIIVKGLETISHWGAAAATEGETSAKKKNILTTIAQTVANWALNASMGPVLAVILLIVAAMAALALVAVGVIALFNKLSDAYNKDAIAAENAEAAAKSLAEAYNETKQEYEDMIAAMEDYKSARDGLDELTKGTEEYREALKEANRQAMELINQYGLIEGQDFNWVDGEIVINDDSLNRVKREKEKEVDTQYAASQMAAANAKQARATADQTALRRQIRDDNGVGNGDKVWKGIANGVVAGLGLALAPVTGGLSLLATGGAMANSMITDKKSADYDAAINKAIEMGKTNPNLFDNKKAMAEALEIDDKDLIDALWENRNSLEQLSADFNAAEQAEKMAAQNSANEIMDGKGYQNTEAGRMAMEAGGEIYQQIYDEAYDKYKTGKKTSKDTFNDYAEQMGLTDLNGFKMGKRRSDGSVEYSYVDENGQEQKKVATQEEIAATLAAADAANKLEGALSQLRGKIAELNSSSDKGDHAMAQFLSKGNLEGATKEEFEDLKNDVTTNGKIDDAKVDKALGLTGDAAKDLELAKSMGYESAAAYREAFVKSLEIEWKIPAGIGEKIAGKMTVGAANKVQNTFEDMGQEGGQAFLDTINSIASGADWDALTPDEQTAMLDEIANIDWSSWDAGEQAIEIAEKYGVAIDGTSEAWQRNINQMRDATNALPDLEKMRDTFQQIKDITSDIDLGSIISEEDYNKLVKYNSELEKYFTLLSDGSAQFTGDVLDFQQEIEKQHSQDLVEAIAEYQDRTTEMYNQYMAGVAAVGGDADNVEQYRDSENYVGADGKNYYSGANAQTQLDFLESQGYDSEQIAKWREDLKDGSTYVSTLEEIGSAVNDTATEFHALGEEASKNTQLIQGMMNELALSADSAKEREGLLDSGLINEEAFNHAAMAAHNEEKWEGMDPEEIEDYANHLQNAAGKSALLSEELKKNEEAAEDVALYTKKMNRGIESLSEGIEGWSDVLSKSDAASEEYAEAMGGIKEAMSDVLGVSEDFLSDDFIIENMEDIKKAAEGDAEAIDRLAIAAGRDILVNLQLQDEGVREKVLALHDDLAAQIPDIRVGTTIDDGDFLQKAAEIVETAGMTVEEANAYFRSMGFEPHFETKEVTTMVKKPKVRTHTDYAASVANVSVGGLNIPVPTFDAIQTSWNEGYTEVPETIEVPSMTTDGGKPNFTLTRTNSGAMNNASSSNKGSLNPSSGSGGGGDKEAKTTKGTTTKKNEIVERYKEINDQLDDVQRKMDKASKAADRLWGPARLKQMQAANNALETEVGLLGQKIEEAEGYLAEDRDALEAALPGVSFDSSGNIENYDQIMGDLYSQLSQAEKDAGDEWTEEEKEGIEKIKERIETVKDAIEQYDESKELLQDLEDEQLEKIYQWQDNNYEMLNYELEIDLEINEKKMEYVEYYLGKLEDDSFATAEAYAYVSQQAGLYTDNLKQQSDYLTKLEQDYYAGRISLDAYKEGLADSQGAIIDNLEALTEMKKAMRDYYGDALAKSMEEVSIYTERMEKLNSTLDHYSNIMELVGAKEDTATKGKILDAKAKNLQNEMQTQKKLYEASQAEAQKFKDLMDNAAAGSNEYEMYKANWLAAQEIADEAQENMLSKTEEWAEAMSAVVENELAGFAKTLEESLTGGTSFDELLTSMDRASSLQEEYLTTTNQIYETNKLMRTAQQEIDKTTNSVAKKKLQGFITETAALQDKNKLSQYELDIQQAKYDLLVAEIALEEAQKAKSSVRLSRDSEGNFGYVYTADNSAVADAEQNLADAQNKLYNIGLDGANDYSQKYAQTLQESQDAITELTMQWKNGEIASEEEFNKRKQEIMEYYGKKIEQYSDLHSIALTTDTNVVRDAWSSDFSDMIDKAGEWDDAVNQYFADAAGSMQKWTETCNTVLSETGLDDLDSKVESITTESDKLKETLLGKDGDSGVVGAFRDQAEVAGEVSKSYVEVQNSIDGVIASYEALLKTVNGSYVDPNTPVIDPALQNTETSVSVNNTGTPTSGAGGSGGAGRAGSGGSGSGGSGGAIAAVQDAAKLAAENAKRLADAELAQKAAAASGGTAKASGGRGGGSHQSSDLADSIEAEIAEMEKRLELQKKELEYQKLINDAITVQKDAMAIGGGGKGGSAYDKYELLYEQELEMLKHQEDMQLRMQDNALINTDILTRILEVLEMHTMNAQLGGMLASPGVIGQPEQLLEQSVVIEAHFPDATNSSEIEEAFNSLINRASQYANRT